MAIGVVQSNNGRRLHFLRWQLLLSNSVLVVLRPAATGRSYFHTLLNTIIALDVIGNIPPAFFDDLVRRHGEECARSCG
jgi:hypothetical protein